jgi:hypothetical protein
LDHRFQRLRVQVRIRLLRLSGGQFQDMGLHGLLDKARQVARARPALACEEQANGLIGLR